MGEKITIVLFVYVIVIIPNIIYYFAWERQLDKWLNDEGEN